MEGTGQAVSWLDACVVPTEEVLGLDAATSARIAEVMPIVEAAAQRERVAVDLLCGLIWVESRFRPRAKSPAGAQGLMQLMPSTFGYVRGKLGQTGGDPFDPETNIDAGTWLLGTLIRRYGGNVELALAAYNAGSGNVEKHGGVPPFPETRAYVQAVPRAAEAFRLARTERCQGYETARIVWPGRCDPSPGTARPRVRRQDEPEEDAAGVVLLVLLAALVWGYA